jgi:hypothetical protein
MMLTDNAGAGIATADTIAVAPYTMAGSMSSQGSSLFIEAAGTTERHRQVRSGSLLNSGPTVSNWTRACHALRLPRWI